MKASPLLRQQVNSVLAHFTLPDVYNRYEALDMEDQSTEVVDESPSTPEVSSRSPHIKTTSTRKKKKKG